MPGSTVPVTSQVGGQAYFGSQGEKSKVCMYILGVCVSNNFTFGWLDQWKSLHICLFFL